MTTVASPSKTRLVPISLDESEAMGVAKATCVESGSARLNIWPRLMARFIDGSGFAARRTAKCSSTPGGRQGCLPRIARCCCTAGACPRRRGGTGAPAPFANRRRQLLHRRVVHLRDVFPIHEMIHDGLKIVRPSIAIIDVVGVLPHVAAEDRLAAVHQRVLAVRGLGDDDLAVLDGEPGPARAKLRDAGLNEILFHFRDRPKIGNDLLLQIAGNLVAAAIRLHPLPEVNVVVVLPRIVEEPYILAETALHHILERFSFPLGTLEEVVAFVDVGELVLVV